MNDLASDTPTTCGESDFVIRTLYEIACEYDKGFEHQVRRILELGVKRFDLDIGILSHVSGGSYTVVKQVSPAGVPLHDGDVFPLGNTYCAIAVAADGPVGFEHVAQSEISTHPAYRGFGLESYIGIPVRVKRELYGTLNFSSPDPRPREFSRVDVEALMLMAAWVGSELSRRQTEDELKRAKQELVRQSQEDPLTRLYNRRGLEQKLVRLNRRNEYTGHPLIGMAIDIDDFKAVNDHAGHSIGDQLLVATAEVISASLRPDDICGRVGGDEFMVLLPACSTSEAQAIAERVRGAIGRLAIDTATASISPSASIGVAPLPAGVGTATDALAILGDALRRAKAAGKNAVAG
jgi:diguanylate cyclase (GGDEF)-like protein